MQSSATISYANAAAKASTDVELIVPTQSEDGATTTPTNSTVNETEIATGDNNPDSVEDTVPAVDSEEEKPKKSLAPAPIPSKSVWGASGAEDPSKTIDDLLWPTAEKGVQKQVEQQSQPQKFIKPITNKWVPIPAKVVISGSKPGSKSQPRNRKGKKAQGNGATVKKNNKKKEDGDDSESIDDEKRSGKQHINGKRYPNNSVNVNHGTSPYKGGKPQGSQGVPVIPGVAGVASQGRSAASPGQNPYLNATNGFYHPQPFTPNGFSPNSRQFRANSGANNGQRGAVPSYPMNGYGFYPQVQIPPPISPKQDPEQALVQQIDYYFSLENLIRDFYLRKNMTEDGGWVPLGLILEFKRVKIIINGIQNLSETPLDVNVIVKNALESCVNLEVRYLNGVTEDAAVIADIELRVKDNFSQWLLPSQ